MSKVAEDVVHRIFDHIPNESPDHQKVDKEFLINCFLKGHSSSKASSIISNSLQATAVDKRVKMKLHPGRQIYVKQSKDAFLTSELFEKPLVVWRIDKKILSVPCKENIDEGKYFHR
jgi:hypothetical protein